MSSIQFNEFKKQAKDVTNLYTYVDLKLDIEEKQIQVGKTSNISGNDIKMAYDEDAIRNSLINIFNTIPGERFLIPTFGCNLLGYVFAPISQVMANAIGKTILSAITQWEPRVTVNNIFVIGKADENEYDITVRITIPALSQRQIDLVGVISKEGFVENRV